MKMSYVYYEDKLNGTYRSVFSQIELYVQSKNIDEHKREERLGELLDIFLSAQEAGKPVQKIVGNDLEQFCKTFCSDFSAKDRLLNTADWLKSIAWCLIFVSALDIVFYVTDADNVRLTDYASSLNLSGYLIGILLAGALIMFTNVLLRHLMFKTKRISMRTLKAVGCVIAIVSFLIIFIFLDEDTANFFTCPAWLVIVVSGTYILLYYVLRGRKLKYQKIKFSDLVNEEIEKDFPAEMEKKFEKAKQKSLKKGKGELTLEAFLEKEEKDCELTEKLKGLYYAFPFLITACMFVVTLLTDGFDGIGDAVIFVIIMLAVETPLMLGLWHITKSGIKQRRGWLAAKREALDTAMDGRRPDFFTK